MLVRVLLFLLFAICLYLLIRWQVHHAVQNSTQMRLGKIKKIWFDKGIRPREKTIKIELLPEQLAEIAEDRLRFDQVAELLFEQRQHIIARALAEQIQQRFLNKMPAKCLSQVVDYELGEWSVYWSYEQQSLEYYVGRYGIFYTHVDRFGCEHKREKRGYNY